MSGSGELIVAWLSELEWKLTNALNFGDNFAVVGQDFKLGSTGLSHGTALMRKILVKIDAKTGTVN